MKGALCSWWILFTFASALSAGTQVLLKDGQVFDAMDVRRAGDVYVVELQSGAVMTLPVDLIAQVRLTNETDEDDGERIPGVTYGEPQQLAGSPVEPLTPAEAQAVFGDPSSFRRSIIDPTWQPRSGFPDGDVLAGSRSTWRAGVLDPTWLPQSSFPEGDVLSLSRTTWRESIIVNTWTPEDGFAKKKAFWESKPAVPPAPRPVPPTPPRELGLTETPNRALGVTAPVSSFDGVPSARSRPGVHFEFKIPVTASAPAEAIRACARRVLPSVPAGASSRIDVRVADDVRFAVLPIDVYVATAEDDERTRRVLFAVQDETCRPIGGDIRDALGVELDRPSMMKSGIQAYNAALGDGARVLLRTDEEKIDYAFAVVSLVDPALGGSARLPLVLLSEPTDVERLAVTRPGECSLAESKRKKAARKASRKVAEPRVVRDAGRETVAFHTWSGSGGEIVHYTVRLDGQGRVSIERDTIAAHVGAHRDLD